MDTNYFINRIRTSLYKYPTVNLLKMRLNNLAELDRKNIVSQLKHELHKHSNSDIYEPLSALLNRQF